jgi:glycosyltransferase involved in cell wall biosynthesis
MISAVIPVYNERDTVRQAIDSLKNALGDVDHEIIVVDDGSRDGSVELLQAMDGITLIRHEANYGYGSAVKDGIRAASGDTVAIIDSDGTYPAERIPALLNRLDGCEMAVGARHPLPRLNRLAKLVLREIVWLLTRTRVPDLNSGLRVFRKEMAMRYLHLLPDGFSLTTTLTVACLVNRHKIEYVTVPYRPRLGKSKIRPIREFFNFILLIVRLATYFKPLEIFLPVSALLLVSGLAVGLYSLLAFHRVMDLTTVILILFSLQIALLGLLAEIIIKRR